MLAVGLQTILPLDAYAVRHLLSGLIGVGGIVAAWAAARAIGGERAGLFATLALSTCGVWYGAMFDHTKDIPFAAAMTGALYFLIRIGRELPRPHWQPVLLFGVLCGCALGMRVLGEFRCLLCRSRRHRLFADLPTRFAACFRRPFRIRARPGVGHCLRDHDRGVAVGRPGSAQPAARHRCFR